MTAERDCQRCDYPASRHTFPGGGRAVCPVAPMLLAALQRVGCQDRGSCGTDDVDGLCFVCRAIETAVRS